MLSVNEKDIDRITEIFYLLLKGRKPQPVNLPEDYSDNEIKQMVTYLNKFLKEYESATDLIYALSKGELDFEVPRGKILFLHSLKSLQANLRHLTWKTQQIAGGDFSHEVDFMGNFSMAFNTMIRQLKESFQKVESATKAKSEFLANMSHEIRTPMNSILGFLELSLEDPNLPKSHKKNIGTAYNSAKSLLTLINDILDVSKLESGKLELENRVFHLKEMMEDTLQIFEIKCREKGLKLSSYINPALPFYLKGDFIRLRQVIINLLGNALKFTDMSEIIVTADPLIETDIPGMIHFAVSDTGIGIPLERLEKIFEPFTQAESSTSRRFGGTGLGTTISKQLVELMGGEIWAESEAGKGSIFHFTVQMKKADKSGLTIKKDHLIKKNNHNHLSGNKFKILVAEDLEENMMLLRIRLKKAGYSIIEAGNGKEAVEAYKKEKPDIILMDIHMPKMDGFEAARQIREMETGFPKAIPIVALTASVMKEEQDRCFEAGMDAVAPKPINFEKLYQIISYQLSVNSYQLAVDTKTSPELLTANCSLLTDKQMSVNYKKGLQIWQDEKVYNRALLHFCRDFENAGDKIRGLLENGAAAEAFGIAHALKGVSGNLCITDVFRISEKLNEEILKKEKQEILPLVGNLSNALQKAVEFIQKSMIPQAPPLQKADKSLLKNDIISLKNLFMEMLVLFDECNPVLLEPFLEKLSESIGSRQIEPVMQKLDIFDFDAAKTEIVKLAESLDIKVE